MVSGIQGYCWGLLLKNFMVTLKHKKVTLQITFPTCSATFLLGEPRHITDEAPEWLLGVKCGQGQLVIGSLETLEHGAGRPLQGQPGHDSADCKAEGPETGQTTKGLPARGRAAPNPRSLSLSPQMHCNV